MHKNYKLSSVLSRRSGFAAIELIFILAIMGGLIFASSAIYTTWFKSKRNNQLADQIKVYQFAAIKYINDNFRSIDQQTGIVSDSSGKMQDIVVSATDLNSYYSEGTLSTLTNYQIPCVYMTKNLSNQSGTSANNSFKAYLVFGTATLPAKVLSFPDAMAIARNFGGNAGVLVPESAGFIIQGMNDAASVIIAYDLNIATLCGFSGGHGTSGLLDYSLIIDLTQHNKLFSQIKVPTDVLSDNQDVDPSLKRSGNGDVVTMQTNLYLDNVVRESTPNMAAEHRYRSLDYGAVVGGQRVQVKSNAIAGPATTSAQLDINNAGIQAGYIAPISHSIVVGTVCNAIELGTMAQQHSSAIIGGGGQLQCTYNPIFCGGNGYCYIPLKTPGVMYTYSSLRSTGMCPVGSIVAANQPVSGISTSVTCPSISGFTLNQGVHGEITGCNAVISGFSFCTSYQTVCTYKDTNGNIQKILVAALAQLQCSSATSTFTINNFSQENR